MTETFAWLPLAVVVVERLRGVVTPLLIVALGGLFALMLTAGFLPLVVACAALVAAYAIARAPRRLWTLAASAAGPVLGARRGAGRRRAAAGSALAPSLS
jgi:hypothetical protein